MKDELRQLLETTPADQRQNAAREYLQARVLTSLQRSGAMQPLAFHGGTALRFLFALPRYSEDLDFSLERPGPAYDFRRFLTKVRSDLGREGYEVEVKLSEQRTVHSAFVRFLGLAFEVGLSPHKKQVLAIKIEVDTRPPEGSGLETTLVRRHVTLRLQHHDRSSLLAGKLHAVLARPYTKGRDLYDLMWYLADREWPSPNLLMLNNALVQTGWSGPPLDGTNWRDLVRNRLGRLDWSRAAADVQPFLATTAEVDLLTLENLERLL